MENKTYYFDHAATTATDEKVIRAMLPYFNICYGNPSSSYTIGRHNKMVIEESRKKIANCINSKTKEIYFTAGGSESDNLAIKGVVFASDKQKKHIITSKIEHHAVLNTCKSLEKFGVDVSYININKDGIIDLNELEKAINEDTVLISVMTANNEIGTIQPIKKIGMIAHSHNVLFHTDAVQAIGNIKIDVNEMNIDLLSMSAHKFYGPKGIGGLYVRENTRISGIIDGGHQERGKRAGTENVAGIVGMGVAIENANFEIEMYNEKLKKLQKICIEGLNKNFRNIKINGSLENRLSGNVNVSFLGYDSSEILMKLDEKGICLSAGSACNSNENNPSHVLMALGLNKEEINGTIRITFGKENTENDVMYLINELKEIIR